MNCWEACEKPGQFCAAGGSLRGASQSGLPALAIKLRRRWTLCIDRGIRVVTVYGRLQFRPTLDFLGDARAVRGRILARPTRGGSVANRRFDQFVLAHFYYSSYARKSLGRRVDRSRNVHPHYRWCARTTITHAPAAPRQPARAPVRP